MLAATVAFVENHPECFRRTFAVGHVTGSAWVVDPARRLVLLTHHGTLGRWFQLGGHVEDDRTVLNAAWREAREESGVNAIRPLGDEIFDVDVHPIPARGTVAAHLHYDIRFLFEGDPRVPVCRSGESHAVEWMPIERVAALNGDRSLSRMVEKTRRPANAGAV
jgi:8-oxo-dGTP pyrophosphatase MutT (NUDIX family)